MTQEELLTALALVVDALERLGVRYHIGGSLASAAHGVGRSSVDADVIADLSPNHIRPLVRALLPAFYVDEPAARSAIDRRSSFNAIHFDTTVKIDVFVPARTEFARHEMARARPAPFGHRSFVVTSPENLVLRKLRWFRDGGETSERQWLDVQGVLKVQAGRLDQEYMREWAADLGVLDLLERAVGASSL